ncbi:NnrS family protein [Natronospira bacteriovora]|uniref:NnrS family protein n=1 Tax=Natronospira bacteriovora TaxID=3069753 RepID=A0ABU0W3Q1_9GAMM|nr:NnrS family protein [Natronospira sp. AB-CW4]MDQ2068586.1 NnrS family protein [Natronospira sp. AB-CW4]
MSAVKMSLGKSANRDGTSWPVVLQQPFRLFFLAAAWFAVLHAAWWGGMLASGSMGIEGNPFLWHGYHMVFGFAVAIVIGFLLTASANWTGRRVSPPLLTLTLFLCWLVARMAGFFTSPISPLLAQVCDALALWGATVALAYALLKSDNRRNYMFIAVLAALASAATFFVFAEIGLVADIRFGLLRVGLDLMLLLMILMGQRIIPFFTDRRLPTLAVRQSRALMVAAPLSVLLAVLAYHLQQPMLAMSLMLVSAVVLCMQMTLWRSWGSWREPMLWILHIGYLWLVVSLIFRAGSLGFGWMPYSTAGHAVSVGALGALGLGMLARVSLGHTGREIRASGWMVLAFVLVTVAAILRMLTGFPTGLPMQWLFGLSALSWILAWLLFAVSYLPVLLSPRVDGRPG